MYSVTSDRNYCTNSVYPDQLGKGVHRLAISVFDSKLVRGVGAGKKGGGGVVSGG